MVTLAAIAVAVSVVAWTACRERAERRASRLSRRRLSALATSCEALAVQMRGGAPAATALTAAAEVAAELPELARAAALADVAAAASVLSAEAPPLAALGAALGLSLRNGASLAGLADGLADSLRAREAVDRELAESLAGARVSADLLSGLPILGLLLAAGLGAAPLRVLFTTTAGGCCLAIGSGLLCAGRRWTSRLVARAESA